MSCNVLILLSYMDMDDIPMSETIKKKRKNGKQQVWKK